MSKHILQFWSGGADSTYLLLQNLRCGYNVDCTYLEIKNNKYKTKREKKAQEELKEDIRKFCEYFGVVRPTYLTPSSTDVHFYEYPQGVQQVLFATFAILLGQGFYDEIQLGIVLGDDFRGTSLFEDFRAAYLKNVDIDRTLAPITTPIQDVSKEVIYLTLKGYDDAIGTNFLDHITCCERDAKCVCGSSRKLRGICKPCETRQRAVQNIGWVKGERWDKKMLPTQDQSIPDELRPVIARKLARSLKKGPSLKEAVAKHVEQANNDPFGVTFQSFEESQTYDEMTTKVAQCIDEELAEEHPEVKEAVDVGKYEAYKMRKGCLFCTERRSCVRANDALPDCYFGEEYGFKRHFTIGKPFFAVGKHGRPTYYCCGAIAGTGKNSTVYATNGEQFNLSDIWFDKEDVKDVGRGFYNAERGALELFNHRDFVSGPTIVMEGTTPTLGENAQGWAVDGKVIYFDDAHSGLKISVDNGDGTFAVKTVCVQYMDTVPFNEDVSCPKLVLGDYVEATEYFGSKERRIKGWIHEIYKDNIFIRADDEYGGARGNNVKAGTVLLLNYKQEMDDPWSK